MRHEMRRGECSPRFDRQFFWTTRHLTANISLTNKKYAFLLTRTFDRLMSVNYKVLDKPFKPTVFLISFSIVQALHSWS